MSTNTSSFGVFTPNEDLWNMSPHLRDMVATTTEPVRLWNDVVHPAIGKWRDCNGLSGFSLVSGPISSIPDGTPEDKVDEAVGRNLHIFQAVIWYLSQNGFRDRDGSIIEIPPILSQMPFEDPMAEFHKEFVQNGGGYPKQILDDFYHPLITRYIEVLLLLPGWEKSYGAKWEVELFHKSPVLGKRIYLLDRYIVEKALEDYPYPENLSWGPS